MRGARIKCFLRENTEENILKLFVQNKHCRLLDIQVGGESKERCRELQVKRFASV